MADQASPPHAEAGGTINLETKPRQVKAWLDQLPTGEPLAWALEVLKFLTACNRSDLANDRRQQVLELVEPNLGKARNALRALYLQTPPPLDMRKQSLADLAAALLTEAAEGYRLLIQAQLEPRFRLFGGDPLPGFLRGRVNLLCQLLVHYYETLAAVPEGLWLDLHQTYFLAVKLGHAAHPSEAGDPSPTDLYRAALLLAVADPYRMPSHELPWALQLIEQQGALAQLIPATAAHARPGTFAIDHKLDAAPFPLARDHDPLLQAWSLSLNTTEPVKFLTWLINRLAPPAADLDANVDPVLRDPRYPSFLQRLKRQWSASQQRLAARRPPERPLDYQICAGFAGLVARLAEAAADKMEQTEATDLAICQATNLSAGGMTLTKTGELEIAVRVGELVGVRASPGDGWQVGVVRWLRAPRQGEIAFGVQLLAPHAQVTELLPAPEASSGSTALLLSSHRGTPESGLLLVSAGNLPTGSTGRIRLEDKHRGIKIEKRVEIAPGLEACRFRLTA